MFTVLHTKRLGNLPADEGDVRDPGSIPGSGRSPGRGNGNALQYSCLENPMDRGAWRATVHWATQSRTRLSDGAQSIGTANMTDLSWILGCVGPFSNDQ